jgi:hypothetical protein
MHVKTAFSPFWQSKRKPIENFATTSLPIKGRKMEDQAFLNLIQMTVESHGCRIVEVDLENHVVNLDGPDEAIEACARAIADVLGQ